MRSPAGAALVLVLPLLAGLLQFLPGVEGVLGFPWQVGMAAAGAFAAVTLAAVWAFHSRGPASLLYRVVNWAETAVSVGLAMALIYRSGSPGSFFWVGYYALVFQAASLGIYRAYNAGLFLGGPVLLALAFALRGQLGSAGLCLIPGWMGAFTYWQMSRVAVRLAESIRERERLQARIAQLQVSEERARIARDLHDGLGAELSALVWRARALAGEAPEGERRELEGFIERVRQGTDELRSVVWALRAEGQTWGELVAHLRTRCAELCAGEGVELRFDAQGDPALALPGELRLHLARMAQEAVRNAVRHGAPRAVSVELSAEGGLRLAVEDDGRGLPEGALARSQGGLKNLRQRAEASGGTLAVESRPGRTRIEARWPLPHEHVERQRAGGL